jgi:CRP-like cAMP-binding protein
MANATILRSAPLLGAALEAGHFEDIAERCEHRTFARSGVLMRQGDGGSSMFVIISGHVGVDIHSPQGPERVATLGPGDIVGEMSLMTGAPRNATVTATKKTEVLEIGRDALQKLLAENPGLIIRFAQLIEQRDHETKQVQRDAARWNSVGMNRDEIAARMTAYYSD